MLVLVSLAALALEQLASADAKLDYVVLQMARGNCIDFSKPLLDQLNYYYLHCYCCCCY